jgi:hypothetical protein
LNRQEFLEKEAVKDFIDSMIPRISGEIKFFHQYENLKPRTEWSCYSIYNAYENYKWRFSCNIPGTGKVSGNSFKENEKVLEQIELGLKSALKDGNIDCFVKFAISILEWGGVTNNNDVKIKNLNVGILDYFTSVIKRLDTLNVDTNDDFSGIIMNSGFTKIYSLLIKDYIIYDSRVGAALGLLVKLFLDEKKIDYVPKELVFAYGKARGDKSNINKRNPSNERYRFPVLRNDDRHHILNNIRANWLLKDISIKSQFKNESTPIRALESALFMIGYSVKNIRS